MSNASLRRHVRIHVLIMPEVFLSSLAATGLKALLMCFVLFSTVGAYGILQAPDDVLKIAFYKRHKHVFIENEL